MVRDEAVALEVSDQSTAEVPSRTRRAYEPPVLTHLGSVNRLTLGASNGAFTDGSNKHKASPIGG